MSQAIIKLTDATATEIGELLQRERIQAGMSAVGVSILHGIDKRGGTVAKMEQGLELPMPRVLKLLDGYGWDVLIRRRVK